MNYISFYIVSIYMAISLPILALSPDWLINPPDDLPNILQDMPSGEVAQHFQQAAIKISLAKRNPLKKTKDPVWLPDVDYHAIALSALALDFDTEQNNIQLKAFITFLRRVPSHKGARDAEIKLSKDIIFSAIEIVHKKWQLIGYYDASSDSFSSFLKPYFQAIANDEDLRSKLALLVYNSFNSEDDKIYKQFFFFLVKEVHEKIKHLEKQPRKIIKQPKLTEDESAYYQRSYSSDDLPVEYSAIFNNDGFKIGNEMPTGSAEFIVGKPIEKDGVKTGYNIMFPHNVTEESRIFVEVYGGFGPNDGDGFDFAVKDIQRVWQSLLDKDIVVVTLNLPDRLYLDVHQASMPLPLYQSLHHAINNFVEVLQKDPTALLNDLDENSPMLRKLRMLPNLKRYIFGASFGGGVAFRQMQIYPENFHGAISFNGSLTKTPQGSPMNAHLAPDNYLDKKNPLHALIMLNQDDFNVSPAVGLNFAELAIKNSQKISLHVTPRGNPASLDDDILYRGHYHNFYPPFHQKSIKAILRFMKDGPAPDDTMAALNWYKNFYSNDFAAFFCELVHAKKYDSHTKFAKLWDFYNHHFFYFHSAKVDLSRFYKKKLIISKITEYLQTNQNQKYLLSNNKKMTWHILKELFLYQIEKSKRQNIKEHWLNELKSSQLIHNPSKLFDFTGGKRERLLQSICRNTGFAPFEYSEHELKILRENFQRDLSALLDASKNIFFADNEIGFDYALIEDLENKLND